MGDETKTTIPLRAAEWLARGIVTFPEALEFLGRVSYAGGRRAWLAQICHRGRRYRLGRFLTEQEAAAAYDAAARLLHGPMARTNDVGSLP